jgi:hypothetical protein
MLRGIKQRISLKTGITLCGSETETFHTENETQVTLYAGSSRKGLSTVCLFFIGGLMVNVLAIILKVRGFDKNM